MASSPLLDISSLATKADLKVLEVRMDALEARMTSLEVAVIGLGVRLDRMYLTLVAGLFVIVAAMVGVMISV